MDNRIICSANNYTRAEAISKLNSLEWFANSKKEIQDELVNLPESFEGFLNDLCDRPEKFVDFEILEMEDVSINEHFAHVVFKVKSLFNNKIGQKVYTGWKKGTYHSLRGIILLETDNQISHFILRRCTRFAISREIEEAMGSIYPPKSFGDEQFGAIAYVEQQFAQQMRIPSFNFSKYFDLGFIYPDPAMSDNVVGLFAALINDMNVEIIKTYIDGKRYDDKGYSFSYSIKPISELLSFLADTNDGFLLSIFGRLQALNVIKL
jgi:hypothetical protein